MMRVHAPEAIPEIHRSVRRSLTGSREGIALEALSREQFYERARKAYAIVYTSEPRAYGCLILKKGMIFFLKWRESHPDVHPEGLIQTYSRDWRPSRNVATHPI